MLPFPSFFHDRPAIVFRHRARAFTEKQLLRYYVLYYESYGAIFSRSFLFFFFSHFCTPVKEGAREERQKACDRRALWRSYQFRQTNREPSVMNGIRTNAGFTSIQRVGTAKYVIRLLHRSLLRAPVRVFPFSPSLLQNNRRKYTRSVHGSRDPPYCTRIKRLQMNNLR